MLLLSTLGAAPPAPAPAPAPPPAAPLKSPLVPTGTTTSPETDRGVDELIAQVPGRVTPPTAASKTTVQSIPVVQRNVTTTMKPLDVKKHFLGVFKQRGLYVAPEGEKMKPETGEQITGLDTENLVSYTVWIQPSGSQSTVVIAGAEVARPGPVTQGTDAVGPVFPNGWNLTSYRMEAVQGMTYSCQGTPAEIKRFYREELVTKQGYAETEDLVFVKGHTRMWISIAPGVSERQVSLYVQTTPEAPTGKVPTMMPPNAFPEGEPKKAAPTPAPSPSPKR